ncbi:MAG: YbaK/EbsC family protein [Candidatus Omnitrophota bacterium]|nr:YbaK/EbsC family protein [Candidatus Omnitrophota bacterium]
MAIASRLDEFLKNKRVGFEVIPHRKTDTAVETAQADGVPVALFAKVVMVKGGGQHAMVVVPADLRVDLFKLQDVLDTPDVKIEHEREFASAFPDSQPGAMPPFGVLYGVPCYLDYRMVAWDEIYFNAGDHEESIGMKMVDYLRVAKATIVDVAA